MITDNCTVLLLTDQSVLQCKVKFTARCNVRCVLPSADSKRFETWGTRRKAFQVNNSACTFNLATFHNWSRAVRGRIERPGGSGGPGRGCGRGIGKCLLVWSVRVFTLLERNVQINCVRGGVSGDWNEVWSNTVMMQEHFTLKRTLNYSFKGKRNVGRTKNDLQLKSGDNRMPSLACSEEEV